MGLGLKPFNGACMWTSLHDVFYQIFPSEQNLKQSGRWLISGMKFSHDLDGQQERIVVSKIVKGWKLQQLLG